MLDIQYIREHAKEVQKGIAHRGLKLDIKKLLAVDTKRLKALQEVEEQRSKKNKISAQIAQAEAGDRKKLISDAKKLDGQVTSLEKKLKEFNETFSELMLELPNVPASDVPVGKDEDDNELIRTVGKPPKFTFQPQEATDLGKSLDVIDVERAAKVSGARFGYLKGGAALIEFALIRYVLDRLLPEGFIPIVPPVFIKPEMMEAMGFLVRGGEEDTYHFTGNDDDLYLVGTSEQAVVPLHAGEILPLEKLPLRYIAFSSCFRREAGSYGKDTKGIIGVHQFDKLEMVSYSTPEQSDTEHEYLLEVQEKLMKDLKLPYRVMKLCTADLTNSSARTYDIETWIPSQKSYRETHSVSSTRDFQTRRLNIRYRDADKKTHLAHSLNGTAFAIQRMIVALLENGQQEDGSVTLPNVLHQYLPKGYDKLVQP